VNVDDIQPNSPPAARAEKLVKVALAAWLAVAMYVQLDLGLADQGDFLRAIGWFTPGPVGLDAKPILGAPHFMDRYFYYYLPYWRYHSDAIDHALHAGDWGKTSTGLLWLPGVLVNRLAYSDEVIYLPVVSLLPRLLLFGALLALFAWIDAGGGRHKLALLLLLGVPLTLLLSTTDYLVYLNSFYQETGSIIYLGLWIASLLYLKRRPKSLLRGLLCAAALTLLVCAKASNIYWAVLGVAFLALVWRPWEQCGRRTLRLTALYAALTGGILVTYETCAHNRVHVRLNAYQGLFYGILTFSENPSAHLAKLGYADHADCVGVSVFGPEGARFLKRQGGRLSSLDFLRVAWAEPRAMLRMLKFAIDNLQDISLDYLGNHTAFDPRAKPYAPPPVGITTERWWPPGSVSLLNLWSFVKFHAFPTGYAFLLTIGLYVAVFLALLRREGFSADLALIGLMTAAACIVDACVAICGDGKPELIKHLFLANLLFDLATIAFIAVIGLAVRQRRTIR
jgi:hypothetical protein